jgi:hypothetical protein
MDRGGASIGNLEGQTEEKKNLGGKIFFKKIKLGVNKWLRPYLQYIRHCNFIEKKNVFLNQIVENKSFGIAIFKKIAILKSQKICVFKSHARYMSAFVKCQIAILPDN